MSEDSASSALRIRISGTDIQTRTLPSGESVVEVTVHPKKAEPHPVVVDDFDLEVDRTDVVVDCLPPIEKQTRTLTYLTDDEVAILLELVEQAIVHPWVGPRYEVLKALSAKLVARCDAKGKSNVP